MRKHSAHIAVVIALVFIHSVEVLAGDITWFFGNRAAIEFKNNVATPSRWSGSTKSAAGMVWDNNGKPLLYMVRRFTYNSAHDTVCSNPPQLFNAPECVFLRKPGSNDTIYSFQSHQHDDGMLNVNWELLQEGAFTAHKYSLSGDAGRASVKLASDTLVMPFIDRKVAGKVAGAASLVIPNTNGRDYWLLIPLIYPSELLVYAVTTNGIIKPPYVFESSLPIRHWWVETESDTGLRASNYGTYAGEVKASLDGTRVALSGGLRGRVYLYDFNPTTGSLSNEREISDPELWQDDYFRKNRSAVEPYGVEFSPDGKLLYVSNTTYDINFIVSPVATYLDSIQGALYQYDVTLPSALDIRGSKQTIVPLSYDNPIGGLQLGPDGKIWVAQREKNFVSCIENPNARGSYCGYKKVALTLSDSALCGLGFPAVPISQLSSLPSITSEDVCMGDTMHITLRGSFITDSVLWDFGDQTSGTSNFVNGNIGTHYYSSPGAYLVSATMYIGSEAQPTVRQWVYVHERPTAQAISSRNPVCEGDSVTLHSLGGVTARWFLGATLVAEGREVVVRPSESVVYTCIVESAFGCTDTAEVAIVTKSSPIVFVAGDTALCAGGRALLTARGASSYTWDSSPRDYRATFSDSTAYIYPAKTTTYYCTGLNAVGCSTTLQHLVRVDQMPSLTTLGDTTVCGATLSTISAKGAHKYLWIDDRGDTISNDSSISIYVDRTTSFTVKGSNGACETLGKVVISVLPGPQVTVVGDTLICGTGTAKLTASGFNFIKWIDDYGQAISRSSTIVVAPSITTRYRAVTDADLSCADTAEFTVRVGSPPVVSASLSKNMVCVGDTVVLTASGAENCLWFDELGNYVGEGDSIVVVATVTKSFEVTATDSIGCSSSSAMELRVIASGSIWFDVPDTVVDVADGRIELPVQMHVPSTMIGSSIGPVRLLIAVSKRSLYIDSIVGMPTNGMETSFVTNDTFELRIGSLPITTAIQQIARVHALPLVDNNSTSYISVRLQELYATANCEQDSVNDGELRITGCGRKLHGGVSFVTPANMRVDPNPATDHITINATSGLPGTHTIEVVNAIGQIVYMKTLHNATGDVISESLHIPTTDLSAGLHEARLRTPVGVFSAIVVVVR